MSTPTALCLYASLDADTNLHIIFNVLYGKGRSRDSSNSRQTPTWPTMSSSLTTRTGFRQFQDLRFSR